MMKQYEIVIVNLDPTIGSEIKKTRPCVILSPDEINKYLKTIVIAPITSTHKDYPTRIKIKYGRSNSSVVIDRIRTIDKSRIVEVKTRLSRKEIDIIKKTISNTFVL